MTGDNYGQEPEIPIDTSVAHPARVWDYWLGGKDHYRPDQDVGDQLEETIPEVALWARADREFLGRLVRHVIVEEGVRQFLDVGTGIPTADNTHQVAQRLAPESRVVYVDNDPIVLAHARALLTSSPEGATDYIDANLHDPATILDEASRTLDFSQPVLITLLGILEFSVTDEAYSIVNRLLEPFPSGTHLAIACPSNEANTEAMNEVERKWNDSGATPILMRSAADLKRFFENLELLDPGLVPLPKWRPTPGTLYADRDMDFYCAVARKP